MFTRLLAWGISKDFGVPYAVALKRVQHMRDGHGLGNTLLEKHGYDQHYMNTPTFVYTIKLMQCVSCGLTYLDSGFEVRDPLHLYRGAPKPPQPHPLGEDVHARRQSL